jgi:hypothetical protein
MTKKSSVPVINKDQSDPGEDQGHSRSKARVDSKGNLELFPTMVDTPLYVASEDLIKAKAMMQTAMMKFEEAEESWVDEMKNIRKKKINHKGDIIECVIGRTTEDHARFRKS